MAAIAAPTALVVSIFLLQLLPQAAECRSFYFRNNCPYPVWPATLGSPPLPQTGFQLQPGHAVSLATPLHWYGRLWGRSLCSTDAAGRFSCATGDCGTGQVACGGAGGMPPATLAEFTLDGDGRNDFYVVSNVDGSNIPVMVAPLGGSGCGTAACAADMNARCPPELQVVWGGCVVACRSGCLAFGADAYCCRGSFGSPETCQPTNYSMVFKSACPLASSYGYDNNTSTFTCAGGVDYLIEFCP